MQSIYRKQPQSEKAFKLQLPSSVDDPASLGSEDIGKPENISAPESSPDPESETFEDDTENMEIDEDDDDYEDIPDEVIFSPVSSKFFKKLFQMS